MDASQESSSLDKTSLATISLLESRLRRIEHMLYGPSAPPAQAPSSSATTSLAQLQHRFNVLIRRFRVYAELLKIRKANPTLFHSSPSSDQKLPPTDLPPAAILATVLSYASRFSQTASALVAAAPDNTIESAVPDTKLSAELASLIPRMKGLEAMQLAQEAEIAELRERSEAVMKAWYERRVLGYGKFVAEGEGRVEKCELRVRRAERVREMDAVIQ
ncbi:hypothetical protein QBC32DRAFT_136042 [Pseudoneurospora amorphoporcata]|uniref:Uncharacterized protein n=1 Tax=Pseudoneurospora amorphoporcata TaxID=241081 RepID=A0AAN6NXC1_9PEZI|nr:hypothetical protein QBC32DRAFT_136042 [Pseudoneurospora amorphoporcata]